MTPSRDTWVQELAQVLMLAPTLAQVVPQMAARMVASLVVCQIVVCQMVGLET